MPDGLVIYLLIIVFLYVYLIKDKKNSIWKKKISHLVLERRPFSSYKNHKLTPSGLQKWQLGLCLKSKVQCHWSSPAGKTSPPLPPQHGNGHPAGNTEHGWLPPRTAKAAKNDNPRLSDYVTRSPDWNHKKVSQH